MKEKKKVSFACFFCGEVCREEHLTDLDGKKMCPHCLTSETVICSHCGERIWSVDNQGTLSMPLCGNDLRVVPINFIESNGMSTSAIP